MKTHQMIELPSAIGNLEDNSPIYIYNTINIFCAAIDINELVRKYQGDVEEEDAVAAEIQQNMESEMRSE